MRNRTLRVNVLLQRELSDILRRDYQTDAVSLTITEVRVAPDLRDARVFVSVVGDDDHAQDRIRWLRRQSADIRRELSRRIVLKFLPKLEYVLDRAAERGTRIMQLLNDLDAPETGGDK